MPNVESIYQQTVLPLPPSDRLLLAKMILEHVNDKPVSSNGRRSVLDILESVSVKRVFKDAAAVDKHIRSERDSWDD